MAFLDRFFTTDPFTRRKRIATFWVILLVAVACCVGVGFLIIAIEK